MINFSLGCCVCSTNLIVPGKCKSVKTHISDVITVWLGNTHMRANASMANVPPNFGHVHCPYLKTQGPTLPSASRPYVELHSWLPQIRRWVKLGTLPSLQKHHTQHDLVLLNKLCHRITNLLRLRPRDLLSKSNLT